MAVGARTGDILQQFLIEAVLVCLLGGAAQQVGGAPGLLQGLEVVAGQQGGADRAQLLGLIGIHNLAGLAATQM